MGKHKRTHIMLLRSIHITILVQTCSLLIEFLLSVFELRIRPGCRLFFACELIEGLTFLDSKDTGLRLSTNPNSIRSECRKSEINEQSAILLQAPFTQREIVLGHSSLSL
jgi:hypothetical protein